MKFFLLSPVLWLSLLITITHAPEKNRVTGTEPSFPAIELQLMDSTTFKTEKIGKEKPVVFLFFYTTCEHCQQEAKDLLKHKEKFKNIQLVMASTESLVLIKKFYKDYSLAGIDKLIIGKDHRFTGLRYFAFESYPYAAVYSRNHKHIKSFERNFTTGDILNLLKKEGEIR